MTAMVRPDPAHDRAPVELPYPDGGGHTLEVLDASGHLVAGFLLGPGEGVHLYEVPLNGLDAGSCMLRLLDGAGTPLGMGRFVKQ